ncbi:MAG: vapC2 [Gammaproteobacteria bacterium]|jgi:tRNA(fMet)-specific endonuclease VapC|nr:vapC2 [Gammaproteobacteria bacterium]
MSILKSYMLDTNTASYIIKGTYPTIRKNLLKNSQEDICISSITQAELLFGVAKKKNAKNLEIAVNEFLLRVDILPWDSEAAEWYAKLRTQAEADGTPLGAMDMLIAAHAVATGCTLVTNDQAFYKLKHYIKLVDWSK